VAGHQHALTLMSEGQRQDKVMQFVASAGMHGNMTA